MRLSAIALGTLLLALPLAAQEKTKKPAPSPEVTQGLKLFKAANFAEALQYFKAAAEKNPADKYAIKLKSLLSRVVTYSKVIKNEKLKNWGKIAAFLHKFYTVNGFPKLALPLSKRMWNKLQTASAGLTYAQNLMAQANDLDAVEVYEKLIKKQDRPEFRAMAAILNLRLRNIDEAREHMQAIPKDAEGPTLCYNIACIYSILGELDKAAHCLKRAFELTPPKKLKVTKKQAMADKDLAQLKGTAQFKQAMQAKSTVPDPKDCGSCPSKAGCGGCPSGGSSSGGSSDK